MIHPKVIVS